MTDVTNNRFYRTPAPTVDDSELVERVADAMLNATRAYVDLPRTSINKLRVDSKASYLREAKAALSAINIPAIKAQARREALEEAAKICAEYPYAMPMEEEIRKLIEKEDSDGQS